MFGAQIKVCPRICSTIAVLANVGTSRLVGTFSYEQQAGYDHLVHPDPHPDPHFSPRSLSNHTNVHFYQPPSCPYSYPGFEPSVEGSGYGSSSMSLSSNGYAYQIVHAPLPQSVPDIHTLRGTTMDDSPRSMVHPHRVLSIPSIPAPPPIPRSSSLIKDSPTKPLTIACFFCRRRKIECKSPPANSPDNTCKRVSYFLLE